MTKLTMRRVDSSRCGETRVGESYEVRDGLTFALIPIDGNMEKNAKRLATEICKAVNSHRRRVNASRKVKP